MTYILDHHGNPIKLTIISQFKRNFTDGVLLLETHTPSQLQFLAHKIAALDDALRSSNEGKKNLKGFLLTEVNQIDKQKWKVFYEKDHQTIQGTVLVDGGSSTSWHGPQWEIHTSESWEFPKG